MINSLSKNKIIKTKLANKLTKIKTILIIRNPHTVYTIYINIKRYVSPFMAINTLYKSCSCVSALFLYIIFAYLIESYMVHMDLFTDIKKKNQ